ncbi:caspase, EACC1-associated type [Streptomyces sp. 7R007]
MDADLSRARALLIGNGVYRDARIPNLPAAACVQAMAALLTGPLCRWPADRVTTLVDVSSPGDLARKVIAAIDDTDDVLLVYYVGHGVRTSDGQLALTVGDTDADPRALPHTALLYENLAKILRHCRAATTLVLLDCCHAELANKATYVFQSVDFGETYPIDGVYVIGASGSHMKAKTLPNATLTCFTEAFLSVVRRGIPEEPDPELSLERIFLELRAELGRKLLPEPVESGARGAHRYRFALNAAHPAHREKLIEGGEDVVVPEVPPRLDRRTLLTGAGTIGLTVANTLLTLNGRLTGTATGSHADPPGNHASTSATKAAMTALGQPVLGHTDRVYSVAFHPGGRVLVSGSADQTVRFWDLTDPARPKPVGAPFPGHTDTVYSVVFSPDGKLLADAGADQKVRLLTVADPAKPVTLSRPATGHTDAVFSVAFAPSGELLAGGSGDRTLRLWNVSDPARPKLLGGPVLGHTDAVLSVAFSHDESVLGSGGSDHAVRLWNVADPPAPIGPALPGHTDRVYCVTFSPNGHLLASGSGDHTIRLWNVKDPANPAFLGHATGHSDAVNAVAFSPDGRVLASAGSDKTIRLWHVTESTAPSLLAHPLTGHTDAVYAVAFSPDGKLLASGSADQTIRLWKHAT